MNMTYRELRDLLSEMPGERLDDDVTIFDGRAEECIPASEFGVLEKIDQEGNTCDVLDDGHYVIGINMTARIEPN